MHQCILGRRLTCPATTRPHHKPRGRVSADLVRWYYDGLAALVETLCTTADDAPAMVFLRDAPAPRRSWARRQAHETTIHGVDAISAVQYPDPLEPTGRRARAERQLRVKVSAGFAGRP
ncbi:maleylpyruvate isomerase N-terminal domain-containing protein [Micromonospora sp. NPDC007230]|uniref:maleylpyruvate isomerase N-terminal domain-containing protein n=1 Tax=Micromonospora sp. NPDC007230 TaxID=3364237 RepID=UPI00367A2A5F